MPISRFDTFLPNDYAYQVYSPQEFTPDLGMLDELLGGLQKEYDTNTAALSKIMPNYLRNSPTDIEAARAFRDKYDKLLEESTAAFAEGRVNEGRRLMAQGMREIESDQLPGGDFYELERRVGEYGEQDKILKETYLNPSSKQYNPEAYTYYKDQLDQGLSSYRDESGNYGTIAAPGTTKMYADEELNQMYITGIANLPADQFAVGPEFSSRLSGLTLGDVMSQGLTKMVDADKVSAALQGMTGRDIVASEQEKQRIAGQEPTDWMIDGKFNPADPLGKRLLNLTKAYSFTQKTMDHRFLPSNFGGEGKTGRTSNGDEVITTSTPDAIIIQNPVTTEVKSDNQLAEDGSVLEPDQGIEIYHNTERLYNQKAKGFSETLRTTLSNQQLDPAILDSVFFKYAPDTQEEFGTIDDADYLPLASEIFNDDSKYNELVSSIQRSDADMTFEQAKLKADQLITQADYLYMGMNEDLAYRKTVNEKYRDVYIKTNLDPIQQELVNYDFNNTSENFSKTEYFKTQVAPLTDPNILFEGIAKSPILNKLRSAQQQGYITKEQYSKAVQDIEYYRDKAEGALGEPSSDELKKIIEESPLIQQGAKQGTDPLILRGLARNLWREQKRAEVTEDLVAQIGKNTTLVTTLKVFAKKEADKLNNEISKYHDTVVHSKVSSEIIPDMKRNMPVLNYLSAGFDHESEVNYSKLSDIQRLQIDGRGVTATTTADGNLQEASGLVASANMYRVTPGQMFEKDGFVFETVMDNNKLGLKDKDKVAGVKVMGFVKAPDDKIYYYGQLQMSETNKKKPGEAITGGDYVYFNYSEADDLTGKYYKALGVNSNVYEDLRFFNKQLDMDKIRNTDGNKAVDTYTDTKYLGDQPVTISRNKKADGSYGYRLKIGDRYMFNNTTVSDAKLALALSKLKESKFGTGQRGDRHNNPLAFTTDVAKQAGLTPGIDYEVGDKFTGTDGKLYNTAKIIGDPVSATMKVIDKVGFYTSDGRRRWKHTAMTKNKWDSLPYERKVQVIQEMERQEGGSLLNSMNNG